jgi:hypothetical protein
VQENGLPGMTVRIRRSGLFFLSHPAKERPLKTTSKGSKETNPMKTFHVGFIPRPGFVVLATVLLGLAETPTHAASSGELDPSFDPVATETPDSRNVFTVGRDVFLNGYTNGLFRFQENGRLDATWKLSAPLIPSRFPFSATPTPFGGWLVSGSGTFPYVDFGDGTYQRLAASFNNPHSLLPQDDGSVVVDAGSLAPDRDNPDGSLDPTYSQSNRRLVSVSFSDGATISVSGGPILELGGDSQ